MKGTLDTLNGTSSHKPHTQREAMDPRTRDHKGSWTEFIIPLEQYASSMMSTYRGNLSRLRVALRMLANTMAEHSWDSARGGGGR